MEKLCCFCGVKYEGMGYDPAPIDMDEGRRCCSECYKIVVVPARARFRLRQRQEKVDVIGDEKSKFYNRPGEQNKEWFLSELTDKIKQKQCRNLFIRATLREEEIDKDILDFNLRDCEELLKHLSPPSINSQHSYISHFRCYINWGIEKNKVANMRNPWDNIDATDTTYIKATRKRKYIKNIDELNEAVDTLDRKYDRLTIYMLYCGLLGKKCIELINAKDEDVNIENKTIKITARNNQVIPLCDEFFVEYKSFAYNNYKEKNPIDENSRYLIKPFENTLRKIDTPVLYGTIMNIVKKLNKNYFELKEYQSSYNATTIWKSGMFYNIFLLEKEKGELSKEDYDSIAFRYGFSRTIVRLQLLAKEYKIYREAFWE